MTFPPSILKVRVNTGDGKKISIWLPVFLIWPVALLLGLVLFPLILLIAIGLMLSGRREGATLLMAGPLLLNLICSMRGLKVDVWQPANTVYLELM